MPYIVDRGNIIHVNVNAKYNHKSLHYPTHDLNSVFTHWDNNLKRNISTENKLDDGGIDKNAKGSK